MLSLHDVTWQRPGGDTLFSSVTITIHRHDKVALVGNNGSGKSTLLKILAGHIQPSVGHVVPSSRVWYVPQMVDTMNGVTVAQVLGIDNKLHALKAILNGDVTAETL